jgi:hypothetical protein
MSNVTARANFSRDLQCLCNLTANVIMGTIMGRISAFKVKLSS